MTTIHSTDNSSKSNPSRFHSLLSYEQMADEQLQSAYDSILINCDEIIARNEVDTADLHMKVINHLQQIRSCERVIAHASGLKDKHQTDLDNLLASHPQNETLIDTGPSLAPIEKPQADARTPEPAAAVNDAPYPAGQYPMFNPGDRVLTSDGSGTVMHGYGNYKVQIDGGGRLWYPAFELSLYYDQPQSVEDLPWWYEDDKEPFQSSTDDGMIWQMCQGPFDTKDEALTAQSRRTYSPDDDLLDPALAAQGFTAQVTAVAILSDKVEPQPAKLSKAQRDMLELAALDGFVVVARRDNRTRDALRKAGYLVIVHNIGSACQCEITPAGRAALGGQS